MKTPNFSIGCSILSLISAIGFSFKAATTSPSYVFWNTNVDSNSTNKGDYVYLDPGISPTCLQNANSYCKAVFTQNVVPAYGDHPTALAVIHTIFVGKLFVP